MPATRGKKRQHGDNHGIEPSTQSSKRRKLTNPEPLHPLLKKNGIDTSYGWGIVYFYDEKGELISSDKLIKYEVDTTLKIARYKGKEFPFNYIEYEDYIISFDEFKINIKTKKDINNLLEFGSPDRNNEEEPTPKTDDDETENDDDETETEAENDDDDDDDESSLIQNQNPIQIQHPNFHHQHQNPIQYQQENYYQQQNQYQQQMFQQQFSIQTMIRTEITTNLIPWMKEYIDSELQKLKQ